MSTIGFWGAALVSLLAILVHLFAGGRLFVRPFLAQDIPDNQKWMAYYMWHVTTLVGVFLVAGFATAALRPAHADYGAIATAGAAGLVLTAGFVCLKAGASPRRFPAIFLFSLVTAFGLLGLLR